MLLAKQSTLFEQYVKANREFDFFQHLMSVLYCSCYICDCNPPG